MRRTWATSPMHGAFIDDVASHTSVSSVERSMAVIEGRRLEDYLADWLEDDVATFCVDGSGEGVSTAGTAATWALCP